MTKTSKMTIAGRRLRHVCLATVSAAAMLAGASLVASAADVAEVYVPPPDEMPARGSTWWIGIEGSYGLWGLLNLAWGAQDEALAGELCEPEGDCENAGFDPLKLTGWGGALEFGWKPPDGRVDGVVRFRYDVTKEASISETWDGDFNYEPYYDGGEATYKEHHVGLDFEVGRELGVGTYGAPSFRIFGGARLALWNGATAFETRQFEEPGNELPDDYYEEPGCGPTSIGTEPLDGCFAEGHINRWFAGLGPRVGFNGSLPFGGGGFGVDFAGSAAALFGMRGTSWKFDEWVHFDPEEPPDFNSLTFAIVPNLEASAALTWSASANAKLSLGYRVDAYFNVMDTGWPGFEDGPYSTTRIIHGPFAKFQLAFD